MFGVYSMMYSGIRIKNFATFVIVFLLGYSAIRAQTDIYDLSLQDLSKVQIASASKVDQNINEISSTIFIISEKDIREKGYQTLEGVLSELPGFQFRNIQGMNSYVFQRGIPNQNNLTLLLLDGVQINELNSGGFYGGGQYNLSNVKRIEVIYGPASVAYGTNAVSGIINIITKEPDSLQAAAQLTLGSFSTYKGNLSFSYYDPNNDFGVLVSGMYRETDRMDLKGEAGGNYWSNKMENYEKDYAFDIKADYGGFSGGLNYIQKQTTTATLNKSAGTIYRDYGTFWNIRFINGYIKYNGILSENIKLSSIIYNRNSTVLDNTIYHVTDTGRVGYYRPNNLIGIENILDYSYSGNFSVAGGITLEFESLAKGFSISKSNSIDVNPPAPPKPNMLNNRLASIFIEPKITFLKDLYLSGGLRYDNSTVYDDVVTPRIGLSYNVLSYILRITYAEAFRAPKPWDYNDGLGNPALKPERMRSFEVSVAGVLSENLRFSVAGYINRLKNAIIKEEYIDGYKWTNSGEANTEGIETWLRLRYGNFSANMSYTYTNSTDEKDRIIAEISRHTGSAGFTWHFNEQISINLSNMYLGKRENPKVIPTEGVKTLPAYFIWNGTFSVNDFYGVKFSLSVKNIFDTEYYHTSNRSPERYRQPQRTILFTAGYSLF